MVTAERIKRGGFTFQVGQTGSGRWYAGAEGSTGATREAAIAAHLKAARADMRAFDKKSKADTAAHNAREAKLVGKRCGLSYCTRAVDTPAHRKTAAHRNAVAVANARARGEYR